MNLVVDEVGISDNLWHMGRLEVQAVEALLHKSLELHEVVYGRGEEHREHLLGIDSVVVDVVAELDGRDVILELRALRVLGEGDESIFREVEEPTHLVLERFVLGSAVARALQP